jgi:hypothetical protein
MYNLLGIRKCIDILRRLKDAVRRKKKKKCKPKGWFLFTTMLQHTGQFR